MTGRISPRLSLVMAAIAFVVAALSASGLILATDTTGRIIFTAVWAFLGIVWLGNYFRIR